MKERNDLVRGWLRKAESDLVAMDASLKAGAMDAACFHAQQAAEKCLKAYLTSLEAAFPYTHNLNKLIELCSRVDPGFKDLADQADSLNPYAVQLRYDIEFWPDEEHAQQARTTAVAIRNFVLARIPFKVPDS